ncbi:pyrroloquinoline quinone biosynthesis peptide chaperone PqqD [Paracoccus sp. Z118]|uniref:pyrroloquinoline quinone biosynthesis peptide chaperone PqqD n=1 Tax=Paracoccus sp. Z118 TaxID=2851017 RepID=UPI001C2CA915|nr:pyrroloquinoline quinone biosynthesis peptide chaperone PqqD [Paracoccus sp. Z118]MBV0892079.1 pyrroloquinoline quinone biosynthesis peptide chaperone PqqD [Paracoccus sp. Z118]
MTGADRPFLPRGVRLHHDRVRDVPVLLGPETALMLDPVGQAVLAEVDGQRDIATISAALAERYAAPVEMIEGDVIEFLNDMALRRLVEAR